ncbi:MULTISPECIES: lactonase family protein [unclassified Streptomyces]|uniref:lactonase family protein n=1 Tax=unclassified Streptomyces TaxID=2593676 RepID=UPI002E80C9A5|nr:lactonase family protein [Streptomyces sp. NBC_00589]WTI33902.1 lactonase family protein [Streptomyces sp. NBC_00775]WUB32425.1 lactonase family protein [Streptomyces sp. NBC_00589]
MSDAPRVPTAARPDAPSRPPSRRTVLGAVAASAAASVPLLAAAPAEAAARSRTTDLLYIGTWGRGQVYAVRFDPALATLTPIGPVAQVSSNWVAVHPTRPVLYVAGSEQGGFIRFFHIDRATGGLGQLGEIETETVPAGSGGLSYIGVDRRSDTLMVADFAAGTVVSVPLGRDGGLGAPASLVVDTGSGPSPRQQGPHPHHVVVDPSGRFALVADFGADRVFVYGFDGATRALSAGAPDGPRSYATAPGSGPRRLVFHPDGTTVYLLNELTADIQTLCWNAEEGLLTHRQTLPTNAPGHTGTTSAAELAISRDGRFLYVSNRGENALVVFSTDRRTGLLTEIQRIPCAGTTPWSFSVHRGGRWLFVANEASSTVNLFSIDPRSGRLTDTGTSVPVPNPDCITFAYH